MPRLDRAAVAALAVSLSSAPAPAQDAETLAHGEKVFERTCAVCHVKRMNPEKVRTQRDLAAPPMNLMTTHMRMKMNNSKEAFIDHMVDFTLNPTRAKAKAMPRAINRFGLMPSIRTIAPDITKADIRAVGEWAWHHYDYAQMKKELQRHLHGEHGHRRGMGQGRRTGGGRGSAEGPGQP